VTRLRLLKGPGGLTEVWKLALPVILSQTIDTLMIFTDRLFLARLGKVHLAATMAGGLAAILAGMFLAGLLGQVTGFVAQYKGARRYKSCSVMVSQGLMVAAALSLPMLWLAWSGSSDMFRLLGHSGLLHSLEVDYFHILAWTVVTSSLRTVLAGFFTGIGQTGLVMKSSLAGVVVNIPLSWTLIFGRWGMPRMGMEGAALATVLSSLILVLYLLVKYLSRTCHQQFHTRTFHGPDLSLILRLFRFGLPAGLTKFLGMAAFTVFMLSLQSLGEDEAAAITIIGNWDIVSALPLIGIGQAGMSLTGQYKGAGRFKLARRAGLSAFLVAACSSLFLISIYLLFTEPLVQVFDSSSNSGQYQKVHAISVVLLQLSCIYLLFDAAYLVLSSIVIGAGDTRWSMIVSLLIEWFYTGLVIWGIRGGHFDIIDSWLVMIGMVVSLALAFGGRFLSGRWLQAAMIE
jgi:MATE family multidrug resistance protein